jgi:hypothetical protein
MAQETSFCVHSWDAVRLFSRRNRRRELASCLLACIAALIGASSTSAQNAQQQFVYASVPVTTATSEIVGFVKGGAPIPGSPLSDTLEGGPVAIDALGRFLFILNPVTSSVSMFQINQSTGALTPALGSPFAVGPTENPNMAPNAPECLATESSGQFLYVGYKNGNFPGESAIIEFQIDASIPQLIAPTTPAGVTDVLYSPVAMVSDPLEHLFVSFGGDESSANQGRGTNIYSIDVTPRSGQLSLTGTAGSGNPERSMTIDPPGRFFFDGWGTGEGSIESAQVSGDGTATEIISTIGLPGPENFPSAMLVDSGGKFLYVQQSQGLAIYSISSSGALTATLSSASLLDFRAGSAAADPQGPFIYSLQNDGIHVFQIDPQSGGLLALGSVLAVAPGSGIGGLAVSGAPVQAASGPAAELFPPQVAFDTVNVGQPSSTKTLALTNTGGEVLSVGSVAVTGANAGDFIATANCAAPLSSDNSCNISIVFTPSAAGSRKAILTVNDTAGAQTAQLTGTGVAPQSAVTLVPGTLSFAATNQGTTSAPQVVTVTSSGAAPLHISSVAVSGANAGDFNLVPGGCNGAYPVNASCSITATFTPFADGFRTASITIVDDAPDSPQSVQLSGTGTGTGVPVGKPGASLSPNSISFSSTTQGATSGAQSITLSSSGTAPLHISANSPILLMGANPNDFVMSNGCTQVSYAAGGACTIGVKFSPTATGQRSATLTVSDDAPNSPQSVTLTGNSATTAFTLAPAASGGTSVTIIAGQIATYNLLLVPGAGFTGSVSLACGGGPAMATCMAQTASNNASSGTISVTGVNAVPFTVTVATVASGSIPVSSLWQPRLRSLPAVASLFLMLICLAGSLFWATGRGSRKRWVYGAAFAMLALIALLAAAGCGGGSSGGGVVAPPPTTPSQSTFTIGVTPSATNANGTALAGLQSLQLTLIVN